LTGLAVTDGINYFVYGKSIQKPGEFGLIRVRFREDGHVESLSSQAIRSAEEENRFRRP
jgi:hypothetical protein